MGKTLDLSTLKLSVGTHEITAKARASGYKDSEPSNAVSYVVRQTITFTIGGTTYYAEEGMTWGEWVDSEYNTGGFYLGYISGWNGIVTTDDITAVYGTDGNFVHEPHKITADTSYKIKEIGGHGGGTN